MRRASDLAPFAGHDPFEKELGTPAPRLSERAKAIIASKAAAARVGRMKRNASEARGARGTFPFPGHRTLDQVPRRHDWY
jgi:hypothetical protein